jgi:hypothetical protein
MQTDQPIHVVLADDHQVVRHGIKQFLSAAGIDVVAEAGGMMVYLWQTGNNKSFQGLSVAHVKKSRSKKSGANNHMWWIWAGIAGGVVLVIAALALVSRQNDSPSQKAFDPKFEPTVTGAPRVEVLPQDTVDYGNVKLGTTINTVFNVRNVGDEPLIVLGEPKSNLSRAVDRLALSSVRRPLIPATRPRFRCRSCFQQNLNGMTWRNEWNGHGNLTVQGFSVKNGDRDG